MPVVVLNLNGEPTANEPRMLIDKHVREDANDYLIRHRLRVKLVLLVRGGRRQQSILSKPTLSKPDYHVECLPLFVAEPDKRGGRRNLRDGRPDHGDLLPSPTGSRIASGKLLMSSRAARVPHRQTVSQDQYQWGVGVSFPVRRCRGAVAALSVSHREHKRTAYMCAWIRARSASSLRRSLTACRRRFPFGSGWALGPSLDVEVPLAISMCLGAQAVNAALDTTP